MHPVWVLMGLGTSPLSLIRSRARLASGSAKGTADSSALVYGCIGWSITSAEGASSTKEPRYITAMRLEMWDTMLMSWAMNR